MKGTRLYRRWHHRVEEPPPNDFVICISASSKSAVSGTGKTTLGTGFGKTFDASRSGFDAEAQATLAAGELGYDIIPSVEHKSAVVIDEAQGTPGAGSALNKRRGMKTETIETVASILANRDKQLTVIVIVQQFNMLESWMYPLIDAWILIKHGPGHPDGPLATHHKVEMDDYDLKNPKLRTPAVEDLTWPSLPEDDPDYMAMERKKQAAKTKGSDEDDEEVELEKDAQMQLAQHFRNMGKSLLWIENNVEAITYSRETVRKNTTKTDKDSQPATA